MGNSVKEDMSPLRAMAEIDLTLQVVVPPKSLPKVFKLISKDKLFSEREKKLLFDFLFVVHLKDGNYVIAVPYNTSAYEHIKAEIGEEIIDVYG